MFILNPQSGTPIYRQLMDQVRRLVASGQLPPGAPLPSVRELALEHAVNPMTISKAYHLLELEGVLVRNRGKPMTVAARAQKAAPREQRRRQLDADIRELVLAARQLELEKEDIVALIDEHWEDEDARSGRQRRKT
ncbi:MAG TPA: GntR family transcriptional regulator [Gammaproteobacteria bacterium]